MKISEFPVGTTIEVDDAGRYEKHENDIWLSTKNENDSFSSDFIEKEYHDKVKIIAMPFSVVWQLAILLQDEYGTVDAEGEDITLIGLVASAVSEVARQKSFEASVERYEAKKVAD
jgi:hypothetical protein